MKVRLLSTSASRGCRRTARGMRKPTPKGIATNNGMRLFIVELPC